jgi:hypothetical protein
MLGASPAKEECPHTCRLARAQRLGGVATVLELLDSAVDALNAVVEGGTAEDLLRMGQWAADVVAQRSKEEGRGKRVCT